MAEERSDVFSGAGVGGRPGCEDAGGHWRKAMKDAAAGTSL